MRIKTMISEFMMAFFVCTACITILEGVIGMLFFPKMRFGYDAFFSPPIFGFFSVLFGLVTKSRKELSVKQMLFRMAIHLLLIEILVFGLNYLSGMVFEPLVRVVLALSIALIFAAVYLVMWINDRKNAVLFNEKLKLYQSEWG